jgi:hypothetical protein
MDLLAYMVALVQEGFSFQPDNKGSDVDIGGLYNMPKHFFEYF